MQLSTATWDPSVTEMSHGHKNWYKPIKLKFIIQLNKGYNRSKFEPFQLLHSLTMK